MSAWLGLLQLTLLAWCVFAAATSLLAAPFYPWLRARLWRLAPVLRARGLGAFAAAPALVASALTLACFLPSVVGPLAWFGDHCSVHSDHHAHFCWTHPPPNAGSVFGWLALSALGGVLVTILGAAAARFARHVRAARTLVGAARIDSRGCVVVATAQPFALTVGIFRPQAVVSSGLASRLPSSLLDAVIAHERGHVERRDNLLKLAAAIFATVHLRGVRAAIRDDLALACEQACDRHAAESVGDSLLVADAILAAERIMGGAPAPASAPAFSSSLGGPAIAARIEALLESDSSLPRERAPGSPKLVVGMIAAVLVALVAAVPLHDAIETLVSLLDH